MTEKRPRYHEKETLERLYGEEGLTITEMANRLECARTTLYRWLNKHDIDTSDAQKRGGRATRVERATFQSNNFGYEQARAYYNGQSDRVLIHRLIAVAEYGFEAVCGMEVHHGAAPEESTTPWDNRPENITLMEPGEHRRHHVERGDYLPDETKVDAQDLSEVRRLCDDGDLTQQQIADRFEITRSYVSRIANGERGDLIE